MAGATPDKRGARGGGGSGKAPKRGATAKAGTRRRGSRRSNPFRYDEQQLVQAGVTAGRLAGVDEVGRGCLAGPLVAACVVLDYGQKPARLLRGVTDSKALTAANREELYGRIIAAAHHVSIIAVSPGRIDREGLHRCNLAALVAALERARPHYDRALVDGFGLERPDLAIVRVNGGDWLSAAIGAASIVAKVTRDRLMRDLDADHPGYGFADHVGYGTKVHQQALRRLGPTPLHRRSFSLVASICAGEALTLFEAGEDEGDAPAPGGAPTGGA